MQNTTNDMTRGNSMKLIFQFFLPILIGNLFQQLYSFVDSMVVGKGIGDTAIRNYDKWKEIRVQMDTLVEKRPIDTSLSLFGKNFQYPFFAGPVGAVNMHYGDSLNDVSYNDILVSSCVEFGIAAFTGDGMDSNVMVAATEAIKKAGGLGIPTVKPWNVEMIREKMALVKDAGAFAAAMDIDAAGLPFLKNLQQPTVIGFHRK